MEHSQTPPRFRRPPIVGSIFFVLAVAFIAWSMARAEVSVSALITGVPAMWDIAGEMLPPSARDTESFWRLMGSLLTTFQMAVAGGIIGIAISLPLAWLAAWNHSPHPVVYAMTRGFITFCRTVPDLVWALFFVVTVGLGPFAGTLAIVVDTVGYCGRFYAESMEEVDPAPQEALKAMGAGSLSVVVCSTVPAAMPAMTAHSLYAMERAVRSSVILGLVGAGGIGVEIETFMNMFQYSYAATCIVLIFIMVLAMEQLSSWLRRKVL
jgi:phosphonate transport system permease protein